MKKEKILIQTNNYCLGWLPDEHNQLDRLYIIVKAVSCENSVAKPIYVSCVT